MEEPNEEELYRVIKSALQDYRCTYATIDYGSEELQASLETIFSQNGSTKTEYGEKEVLFLANIVAGKLSKAWSQRQDPQEWVSVEKNPVTQDSKYADTWMPIWVKGSLKGSEIGCFDSNYCEWITDNSTVTPREKVTHYMLPLPEPPKEKE